MQHLPDAIGGAHGSGLRVTVVSASMARTLLWWNGLPRSLT
jgi:hypothetical protein